MLRIFLILARFYTIFFNILTSPNYEINKKIFWLTVGVALFLTLVRANMAISVSLLEK